MRYFTFVILLTLVLFFAFTVPSRAAWHTLTNPIDASDNIIGQNDVAGLYSGDALAADCTKTWSSSDNSENINLNASATLNVLATASFTVGNTRVSDLKITGGTICSVHDPFSLPFGTGRVVAQVLKATQVTLTTQLDSAASGSANAQCSNLASLGAVKAIASSVCQNINISTSGSADKKTATVDTGSGLVVAVNEYDLNDPTTQNFYAANPDWSGLSVNFKQHTAGGWHINGSNYTLRLDDSLDGNHCATATLSFNGLGPNPLEKATTLCFNAPAHGTATLRLAVVNRPISSLMKYRWRNKVVFVALIPRSCTLQVTDNQITAAHGQFDLVEQAYDLNA